MVSRVLVCSVQRVFGMRLGISACREDVGLQANTCRIIMYLINEDPSKTSFALSTVVKRLFDGLHR